jgi:hypothetical protein
LRGAFSCRAIVFADILADRFTNDDAARDFALGRSGGDRFDKLGGIRAKMRGS